jgi:hypothetical protein
MNLFVARAAASSMHHPSECYSGYHKWRHQVFTTQSHGRGSSHLTNVLEYKAKVSPFSFHDVHQNLIHRRNWCVEPLSHSLPRTHYSPVLTTGYIGGPALAKILNHPKRNNFDITVLIRDASKATGFESLGVKTVKGSMSDFGLLERLSSESDIIFQSVSIIICNSIIGLTKILQANADDLDATKAILRGLKKRFEHKKEPGMLIHTVSSRPLVRLLSSLS